MTKTFVLAPDSFKESMTAKQACEAMATGILKVYPDANIVSVPMADGGEGTVDSMIDATKGERIYARVSGPLPDEKIEAYFGLLGDKKIAVIEMAKANGIELLAPSLRNPLITSTFGTGELIKAALDLNVQQIIVAIGGSVTNDGGAGMAQALGAKLLDEKGEEIKKGGGSLGTITRIDSSTIDSRLKSTTIIIASDVTNPLVGKNGASVVFGPQKGATPEMVQQLDQNLTHYADIIARDLNIKLHDFPGAGAAGGLGAGLLAFTGATLKPGIEIVTDITKLEDKVASSDYVFTGEGGMDFQTKFGKAPFGVAKIANSHGKPVFACAGYIGEGIDTLYDGGMTAIFGILGKAQSIEAALAAGEENLTRTAENIARMLTIH